MSSKKNIRKNLVVTPRVQFKFVLLILVSLALPTIIVSSWTFSILNEVTALAEGSSDVIQSAIALSIRKLIIILLVGFSVLASLIVWWMFLFSNQILGPIHRLETKITEMIDSQNFDPIQIRKSDAHAGLFQKFNVLLETLRLNK